MTSRYGTGKVLLADMYRAGSSSSALVQPGNILLGTSNLASVKLADFGLSKPLLGTTSRRGSIVGTPFFIAPEVLLLEDEEVERAAAAYTTLSDVWSLGVTLYVLLSGGTFPITTRRAMKDLAMNPTASWRMPPLPDDVGAELSSLVQVRGFDSAKL